MAPLRFAANIGDGWLWSDLPLEERFARASAAGFAGVEAAFPYRAVSAERWLELANRHGLETVCVNTPASLSRGSGDPEWAGLACLPGREKAFMRGVEEAVAFAAAVGCPRVHVMAGALGPAATPEEWRQARRVYVRNVRAAARHAAKAGVVAVVEAINGAALPGYFVSDVPLAVELLREVDEPRSAAGLLLDLYHAQRSGGNLSQIVDEHAPLVEHVQVAGAPDRSEPCYGEINMPFVLDRLAARGYRGWVACEYRPAGGDTDLGLAQWFAHERQRQALAAAGRLGRGGGPASQSALADELQRQVDEATSSSRALPAAILAVVVAVFVVMAFGGGDQFGAGSEPLHYV